MPAVLAVLLYNILLRQVSVGLSCRLPCGIVTECYFRYCWDCGPRCSGDIQPSASSSAFREENRYEQSTFSCRNPFEVKKVLKNNYSQVDTNICSINSHVNLVTHTFALTPENAVTCLEPFDIVVDCTDNPATRYLLSDTCVALKKPLVSGAAQKFEGQLCTYNYGKDGPCYRCLFPKPPRPEFAGSCAELGILGAVTGVIGNLQALEAIKIIVGLHGEFFPRCVRFWRPLNVESPSEAKPSLLLYSALSPTPFRIIKLRTRRSTCPACGDEGQKIGEIASTDYVAFCGGTRPDWETLGLHDGDHRIKAKVSDGNSLLNRLVHSAFQDLAAVLQSHPETRIIDVRPPVEFGICHLPGSISTQCNFSAALLY